MSDSIVIFGASARAAAMSALRAGLSPWCADLFADADLRQLCPAVTVTDYPQAFALTARAAPSAPWMYTGALENHPKLVASISEDRELWGNDAEVLRRVRSPRVVADYLRKRHFCVPAVCETPSEVPRDGRRWLIKPKSSAGGNRIEFWQGERPIPKSCYLQEFIEGESCAATFVGFGARAEFLGATEQLVGWRAVHAKPFSYSGSMGPLSLSDAARANLTALGNALTPGFGLRGLFGVDFIMRDDMPWLVEVNPRYTASVEVLELALKIAALKVHRRAFVPTAAASDPPQPSQPIVGKAIVFAAADLVFPEEGPWQETLTHPFSNFVVPDFADIPSPGQRIEKGQPILTVFATGPNRESCRQKLASAVKLFES